MKRVLILLFIVAFLAAGVFAAIQFYSSRIIIGPLKTLTEERLSAMLGAKVSIGEIDFDLVKHVSLSELKIDAEEEDQNLYLASAKAITFNYDLKSFVDQNFKNPNRVTLDSPQLKLNSLQLPAFLTEEKSLKPIEQGSNFMSQSFQLAIKNGTADYPLMNGAYKIGLEKISGVFIPISKDLIKVRLKAEGTGVFRGKLAIVGEISPISKTYSLHVRFRDKGEIFLPGFMKLKDIEGTFSVKPNKISFKGARFSAADLMFEATGEVSNFESLKAPKISMNCKLLSEKFPHKIDFDMDFEKEMIKGTIQSFDSEYPFYGEIFKVDDSLRIADLEILNGYMVSADLNIGENIYQISVERDPFRASVNFSFDDWDTVLYLNLEHFLVGDIDLVTFLKIRLMPTEAFKEEKEWKFNGRLETDYLIFDTLPVSDLDGTFVIDNFEVKNLKLNWGEGYKVEGNYNLLAPNAFRFALRMNQIDLGELKSLFFYDRPKEFRGIASGVIELNQDPKNPLISGRVEAVNGAVGKLDYQGCYLNFSGYFPYLRLSDSKIARGGKTLNLEGDLNLGAKNILQDLTVVSEDHIVLWRGTVLSDTLQDNLVMIGETLKRKLTE